MTYEQRLKAAQGYMELGLFDDALKELDGFSAVERLDENVLQLRLLILMRTHRWAEGLEVSKTLRQHIPHLSTGYIHGAFCLHELGQTREARKVLLEGPLSLAREATYHYNLACYDALLGNKEEALKHLKTSFEMNDRFRDVAKYDPDLKSLGEFLE